MAYRIAYYNKYLPTTQAITNAVNALNISLKTNKNVDNNKNVLNKIIENLQFLNNEVYPGDKGYSYVPSVYKYEQERSLVAGRVKVLRDAINNTKNSNLISEYAGPADIQIDTSYKLPRNDAEIIQWQKSGWNYPGEGSVGYTEPNIQAPTWDESASRKAAALGISLPAGFKEAVINYAKVKGPQTGVFDFNNPFINDAAARVQDYANNPTGFYTTALVGAGGYYVKANNLYVNPGFGVNPVDSQASKDQLQAIVNGAASIGIPVENIESSIITGATQKQEEYAQADAKGASDPVNRAFDVALGVGQAALTSVLPLPIQIAVSSSWALQQGAKPADVLTNAIATIAADAVVKGIPGIESSKKIPEVIGEINKEIAKLAPGIVSPTVISGLINAERQAIAALITKQDVATNALAGFAGGTLADLTGFTIKSISPKMSNEITQALSRAVAEFGQYRAAGFTEEQALLKAGEGFIAQSAKIESAAQKEKQLTAGLTEEQVGLSKTYGQGYDQTAAFDAGQANQFTGTENKLPAVTVYGTRDTAAPSDLDIIRTAPVGARTTSATDIRSLGPITVYGKKFVDEVVPPEDISKISTDESLTPDTNEQSTQEKTPEQLRRDTILTSLINKKFDRTLTNIPTKKQPTTKTKTTQGGLGTAALAQALRVGDIGAPIFGRDEEGRRAGWNLQSLRYMGDVGAEND